MLSKFTMNLTHIQIITRFATVRCKVRNNIWKENYIFRRNSATYYGSDSSTMQARILNYFRAYEEFNRTLVLDKLCLEEDYKNSLTSPHAIQHKTNNPAFLKKIRDLDTEFSETKLSLHDALNILHNFMFLAPQIVTELQVFKLVVSNWEFQVMSKFEKLQFFYYVALRKPKQQAQLQVATSLSQLTDEFINSLNQFDVSIICLSAYRSSTRIKHKFMLQRISDFLYDDIRIFEDCGLLISYLKSMRHNGHYDTRILTFISKQVNITSKYSEYTFTANAHILAFFADALFYDIQVINYLIEKCCEHLQKTPASSTESHFTKHIRTKDIGRFVWALGYLGYDVPKHVDLNETIIPEIKIRHAKNEYKNDSALLVDTLLSLWILNYRPIDFVKECLTPSVITAIRGSGLRRPKARLDLLLTCINIESGVEDKFPVETHQEPEHKPRYRAEVKKVYKVLLRRLPQLENVSSIRILNKIKHLNVDGISVEHTSGKTIEIEIMDEMVCIRNIKKSVPNGLMKLKLRLLCALKVPVVMVDKQMLSESDDDLAEYLQTSINFLARDK